MQSRRFLTNDMIAVMSCLGPLTFGCMGTPARQGGQEARLVALVAVERGSLGRFPDIARTLAGHY